LDSPSGFFYFLKAIEVSNCFGSGKPPLNNRQAGPALAQAIAICLGGNPVRREAFFVKG
jgi:hypothetical protein